METEMALLELIKEYPNYGPRALKYLFDELGYEISESAVYNIMKRNKLTKKELRISFSKKQDSKITASIPPLPQLSSGECWLFWVTDYGHYDRTGNICAYTLYDLKSRIACTRLYNNVSVENFEDLLTAVAMPIAQTLHLNVSYLCFFKDDKILKRLGKTFQSKISKVFLDNGIDFNIHILTSSYGDLSTIETLRKNYTQECLTFLMPLIQRGSTFTELKMVFQAYIKDYNLNHQFTTDHKTYSPVQYHNKLTNTKLILPLWAYIDRKY